MLAEAPTFGEALLSFEGSDVTRFASSRQSTHSFYVITDLDGITAHEVRRSANPHATVIRKAIGPNSSLEFMFLAETGLKWEVGLTFWAKPIVSPWAPDSIWEDHGRTLAITYATSGLKGEELDALIQEALNNRSALRGQSLQTA